MHEASSFITLTYAPEHLPNPPSLDYRDFQLFLKRLRKQFPKIRFYMCGEYGEEFFRPHFHAAIFGTDFPDKKLHARTGAGHHIYVSDALAKLWPYGYSSVCELNFETAAYVARYIMKKITGDLADEHYKYVDDQTGEVSQLTPEFAHMSLKPGIGGQWYDKYKNDLSLDFVVVNGVKCKPPRYFDKLLKRADTRRFNDVKEAREYSQYLHRAENTDSRLAVKHEVKLAQLSQLSPRRSF